MVVQDATSFLDLIDRFNPTDKSHLDALEEVLKEYPNFQLARAYHLKAIKQQDASRFDQALSHASIATYKRELLYEFIEKTQIPTPLQKVEERTEVLTIESNKEEKTSIEVEEIKSKNKPTPPKEKDSKPSKLSFSEWALYLKNNQKSKPDLSSIEDKFELIDAFLSKNTKITPNKNSENKVDLSEKSWATSDELMTETLAKVFVKQKKYDKALQAFQILRLKYPEKNSFFADQIKEIKRLQKLKD
jgi:tetratricopeptide (TPR) repeat protein